MLQKIINFIKYHNAFAIGISLVLVLSLSAMASEDVRNTLIGQEIITEQGIDNSQILAADLNNFDFQLTIQNVREDPLNYYLDYTYQTLAIKDNIWQPVVKEKTLTVSKEALGQRDLGLYAAEELAEVIDYQLSYLREVQELEKEKGQSQIVQSTTYTGLLGLVLSRETKELAGYLPIIQEPPLESADEDLTGQAEPELEVVSVYQPEIIPPPQSEIIQQPPQQPTQPPIDKELIRQIVQELLAEQPGEPPPSTEPTPTEPICQPTEEICDGIDNNCDGQIDENEVCQPPACIPNWSCTEWGPIPSSTACGQTFTQTRTCTDLNNCGSDEGPEGEQAPYGVKKPIESQETTGNLCSAQNTIGTCQSGTCSFTCQEGYSNCDNDWSNGCEVASTTCPPTEQ